MIDANEFEDPKPLFSNKVYDVLKIIALVVLPTFNALYFGLGDIWNLPKVTEVIGTVSVIDTVLGTVLRTSNVRYKKSDVRFDGNLDVAENFGEKTYTLDVEGHTEKPLDDKKEVLLKVTQEELPPKAVRLAKKKAPRKKV